MSASAHKRRWLGDNVLRDEAVRASGARGVDWQSDVGEALANWYSLSPRTFPWRENADAWPLLVSAFLLQSTVGEQVTQIWHEAVRRYPTPAALAADDETHLMTLVRPLGLPQRAEQLIACARAITDHHEGRVPRDRYSLLQLPGIGPQRASAVRCFAFGEPEPVIGQTSGRVLRRVLGYGDKADDSTVYAAAVSMVPSVRSAEFNYALIDVAATICRPDDPRCLECPARSWCAYAASRWPDG